MKRCEPMHNSDDLLTGEVPLRIPVGLGGSPISQNRRGVSTLQTEGHLCSMRVSGDKTGEKKKTNYLKGNNITGHH